MIPYGRQNITPEDLESVRSVLTCDYLTQGPKISEFEDSLAKKMGSRFAVVFNSGTAALHAAYFSLGISVGDEVITSPITFAATSNAALYLGAKPVFGDVDPKTGNLDLETLEGLITPHTKVLTPVHYAGLPVDMERIHAIAKKYHLKVVEDACHAIGSSFSENATGSCQYSDLTIFSFHPVKHITTGEGGAVLTNNEDLYNQMILFRSHGITRDHFDHEPDGPWYYEMQALGYNYRMTDIQAALGISQLSRLDANVKRRREIAALYTHLFEGNPYFDVQSQPQKSLSSYHLFPLLLRSEMAPHKKNLFLKLKEKGIGCQVHYLPVPAQPYYQKLGYSPHSHPHAMAFYRSEISIPMFPELSEQQVHFVSVTVLNLCQTILG